MAGERPKVENAVWALDSNFVAGGQAWNGKPNKVDPGAALRGSGWKPSNPVEAEYMNYLQNMYGKFMAYMGNLQPHIWQNFTNAQAAINQVLPLYNYPSQAITGNYSTVEPVWCRIAGDGGGGAVNDHVQMSTTWGKTWSAFVAVPANTWKLVAGAENTTNLLVFRRREPNYIDLSYGALTWTNRTITGAAAGKGANKIFWNAAASKWMALGGNAASWDGWYSTDGQNWTAMVFPAHPTGVGTRYDSFAAGYRADNGTVIVLHNTGGTAYRRVLRSTDGGVTWSYTGATGPDLETAVQATQDQYIFQDPVYSSEDGVWLVWAVNATANESKLYSSSDDGVTWALIRRYKTKIYGLACLGSMWVSVAYSMNGTPQVWFSVNAGYAWYATGKSTSINAALADTRIVSGHGGLCMYNTPDIEFSLPFGTPKECISF